MNQHIPSRHKTAGRSELAAVFAHSIPQLSCQQCKSNKLHLLISAVVFKVAADYCLNLNSRLPASTFEHICAHFGSEFARTFGTVKHVMDAMTNQTGLLQATYEDN